MFLLFKRIKIKNSRPINLLAKGSFTVYLLHGVFVSQVGIEYFVNKNIFFLFLHMTVSFVLIYLVCWIVYLVYAKFEKAVFGFLKKKCKLPILEI